MKVHRKSHVVKKVHKAKPVRKSSVAHAHKAPARKSQVVTTHRKRVKP